MRRGIGGGKNRGRGLRDTKYYVYIHINIYMQGYVVQHRKHSQYFIITLNGV